MTQDKYLDMMEQLGKEPVESEIPIAFEDLGEDIQSALNIFNLLGDRVQPEIGYTGKDYTLLPILIDNYGITDKELLVELLNWLDSRAIKKSNDQLKKEYDKIKRKTKG